MDLSVLRAEMRRVGINVLVVPSEDAHNSEYVADDDKRRAFVSGFTGSAGVAVVTESEALLWTDGRYFLQAEAELGEGWNLMKQFTAGTPTITEWLESAPRGRVGVDPFLISKTTGDAWSAAINKTDGELVPATGLVDRLWLDKPNPSSAPVVIHHESGTDIVAKLAAVRAELEKVGASHLLVTDLAEIAWLLNLRVSGFEPLSPETFTQTLSSRRTTQSMTIL